MIRIFVLLVCVLAGACARLPAAQDEQTLRGSIVDLNPPAYGTGHQLATLSTPAGRVVILDLGVPGGEGTIQRGDEVVVSGSYDTLYNHRVFVARTIVQQVR